MRMGCTIINALSERPLTEGHWSEAHGIQLNLIYHDQQYRLSLAGYGPCFSVR